VICRFNQQDEKELSHSSGYIVVKALGICVQNVHCRHQMELVLRSKHVRSFPLAADHSAEL
jgi:hypothetical protein